MRSFVYCVVCLEHQSVVSTNKKIHKNKQNSIKYAKFGQNVQTCS